MGQKPPKRDEQDNKYYGARINKGKKEIYIGCFEDNKYSSTGKLYDQGHLDNEGDFEKQGCLYYEGDFEIGKCMEKVIFSQKIVKFSQELLKG